MMNNKPGLSNPAVAGSIPAAPTTLPFQSLPAANQGLSSPNRDTAILREVLDGRDALTLSSRELSSALLEAQRRKKEREANLLEKTS